MPPAGRQALPARVATAILDGAARALAEHGDAASMADVAAAAGVARATVYRYFPSRQLLLDELTALALQDADERLRAARLDEVPALEGIDRAVRGLVEVGAPLVVLLRDPTRPKDFDRTLARPLARLFERSRAEGHVRDDLPATWLTEVLLGLVVSVVGAAPGRGKEDTVAAITSLFLDGGRRRGPRSL
jgi:TetR/AcrR family transcriptional regulator, mexCD-oprJ operon repressor